MKAKGYVYRCSHPVAKVVSAFFYHGRSSEYENTLEVDLEADAECHRIEGMVCVEGHVAAIIHWNFFDLPRLVASFKDKGLFRC